MSKNKSILNLIAIKLCKRYGHNWLYKDYSNHMKWNGDKYEFRASRRCSRCNQNSYFYTEWKNGDKALLDTESDYQELSQITINNVTYSRKS
jgi:hypothetical protein